MKPSFLIKKKKRPVPPWNEIFSSFGDAILILNEKLSLTGVNPAAENMTGYSAENILGLSLREAFPGNEDIWQKMDRAFQNTGLLHLHALPWASRYSEKRFVDLTTTPLMNEKGDLTGWIIVLRDVSPTMHLEEEKRQTDRLGIMGTLAAGLAHEIKNPLSGIRGAAQLIAREQNSEEAKECLGIILKETERVDRLVTQLLTFSRPRKIPMEPVNLNQLLDEIVTSQKSVFEKKKIKVQREYDPSLPDVLGNSEELTQVFLNILKNAWESFPDSKDGKDSPEVVIKTRIVTDYWLKGQEKGKPIRFVMAEIKDNGIGIPHENVDKIFTPFFTTKEKGTGLGMPLSHRMIEEMGGSIRIQSEDRIGTTVKVFLRTHV